MLRGLSHTKKGFSMVELVLAVALFFIFFAAFSDATYGFWKHQRNAINKERATYLAEEAVEASRSIRDVDFSNLTDGAHGVALSGSQWVFSNNSDTTDIFNRVTTINTISSNKKQVDVVVSWTDETGNNTITINTYLTNWRKITPPAGLTVNKTVINHGLTKTDADFAPYNVGSTEVAIGTPVTLEPGNYSVTETEDVNYIKTYSGDCDLAGNITLAEGDAKICTITNEEKSSQLTVTKNVINHGGTKVISDFPLFVDAIPVTSGVTNTFNSGTHTVSETADPSYTATFSGDCDSSGIVNLVSGTTKTCTITNEESATLPTVTSPTATAITGTTATLGANVTSLGNPAVISARGTCWGATAAPVTNCVAEGGTTTGVFTQARTGFTPGTLYYYRGYATNATGTAYSADGTFTTAASTITFVASNASAGTSITIPAHNVGDLLIVFAYRDGNASAPTVPAGWTTISTSGGANANSSALAYRVATGSDSGAGWSNATELIVHVYRGQNASPIGADNRQAGSGTTVAYPSLTLNVNNGSSWVIGFAGHRSTNTNLQNSPALMTQRSTRVDATAEVSGHDTNSGVTSWNATNVSVGGTSSGWMTRVLEIKGQ